MFGNMWEMKKMYDKYKKLQDSLKNTVIRAREQGVLIDITAEMKIKDLKIEDETLLDSNKKEDIEWYLKTAFEKAQQKAQDVAMEKSKEILWFDPNDMSSMFWGWGGWGMPKIPGM